MNVTTRCSGAAIAVTLLGMTVAAALVPTLASPDFAARPATPALLDDPDNGQPDGPNDPRCAAMPESPMCFGSPFSGPAQPTGPLDIGCVSNPADAACAGSPFLPAPPAPPPPPPPPPDMGIPGMPGTI